MDNSYQLALINDPTAFPSLLCPSALPMRVAMFDVPL